MNQKLPDQDLLQLGKPSKSMIANFASLIYGRRMPFKLNDKPPPLTYISSCGYIRY